MKLRNLIFVLLGVVVLLVKRHYSGPAQVLVHSYAANVAVSFAVYFLCRFAGLDWGIGKLLTAGAAMLVVELFEVTDGFGVMSNVYDPLDLIANAVGVGLALLVDQFTGKSRTVQSDR